MHLFPLLVSLLPRKRVADYPRDKRPRYKITRHTNDRARNEALNVNDQKARRGLSNIYRHPLA